MYASKITRVALAAGIALSASASYAQPNKCQAALEKQVNGYIKSVTGSLKKCIDGVQKATDAGDPIEGDGCDGAVLKIEGARAKALGKCLGAACTNGDLHNLGHLVSGINAPTGIAFGEDAVSNGLSFVCSYIIKRAEHLGIQAALTAVPGAPTLLKAAADADPTPADGIGPFFFGTASGPPWPNAQPSCKTHACTLGGSSGAALRADVSGGAAIPLAVSGVVALDVCKLPSTGYTIDDDARILGAGVGKSLAPVSLLGNNVCTRTLRAEGWCNCGAAVTANQDIDVCRDSCTAGTDGCAQVNELAGAAAGTGACANGALKANYSNPSTTGDCLTTLSTEFKITPPAANGADATACTEDDLVAPTPATGLQLTTGQSIGTVVDGGAGSATESGLDYTDTRTGSPVASCSALDASTLTGLSMVGTAPAMDGTAPIGDSLISLTITCN